MIVRFLYSIFLVLILAFALRVLFLDRVPVGITNDEMSYLLSAKSVFLSGSDISHTWNPFTFTSPKSGNRQAEIPPLLTFWIIGPLPLSMLTSKLIYALFSTGIVALIYLITRKLIGKPEAFVAGLVAAGNPWLIFFGRTAYDTSLAIFFFLLGFYFLLLFKRWKILFVFPAFFIAFYSYIGTKLILFPFSAITIYYAWYSSKKYLKQYILLFILCIAVFASYSFSVLHGEGTRVGEIATPNMESISKTVNTERRLSIYTPATSVLSNKYVVFGKYAVGKYLNAFAPNFLFLTGDGKAQFSLWVQGSFYILDALFLILGVCLLFATKKKVLCLFLALVAIAPLPSVASTVGNSYAIRSMLLAPVFIIFIGVGIYYLVKKYSIAKYIIVILYGLLLINFLNIYFLRNPLYNSESFTFSGRELAKYLSFQKSPVYVINATPRIPYEQYLFYNNLYNFKTMNKVANDYRTGSFSFNNVHFLSCHYADLIPKESIIIYDDCRVIPVSKKDIVITQLSDAGKLFTISGDITCSKYALKEYPHNITFSDLNVEKLSVKDFCETYVTRYRF